MFYELTKKQIPRLESLVVTCKVTGDSIVKILAVNSFLPGRASCLDQDQDLTHFYSDKMQAPELYGWILEYHHDNQEQILKEQKVDHEFDAGKYGHDVA